MVDRLGVDRANETEVVDHPGRVGQELADPGARIAVPGELEERAGQGQGRLVGRHAGQPLALADGFRQVLAVHLVQDRLVIEQVKLRRPAAHEQVDDPLGPGRKMRRRQHALIRDIGRAASGMGGLRSPASSPAAAEPIPRLARKEMAAIEPQAGIIRG